MAILGLALLKFFLYYAVCLIAPRMLQVPVLDRTSFALKWASIRLVVGLVLAFPLFLVVTYIQNIGVPFTVAYVSTLMVARSALWYAIARGIRSKGVPDRRPGSIAAWVAVGLVASFAIDGLANIAGAENFKFFC